MCPLLKDTFCVTTLCNVAGSKVLPSSFHLNGHILGFHPQTQKLEPPCTDGLNGVNREPQPSKIAISTVKRQKAVITVNSRYASVNSSCAHPPPGLTPGHQHFFCFGWQIPGGGDERREQMPHPRGIVAYVLNAKDIITTIFLGHVSVL